MPLGRSSLYTWYQQLMRSTCTGVAFSLPHFTIPLDDPQTQSSDRWCSLSARGPGSSSTPTKVDRSRVDRQEGRPSRERFHGEVEDRQHLVHRGSRRAASMVSSAPSAVKEGSERVQPGDPHITRHLSDCVSGTGTLHYTRSSVARRAATKHENAFSDRPRRNT